LNSSWSFNLGGGSSDDLLPGGTPGGAWSSYWYNNVFNDDASIGYRSRSNQLMDLMTGATDSTPSSSGSSSTATGALVDQSSLQSGVNPSDFLNYYSLLSAMYYLGASRPMRINLSGLPTDDAYQLIIIVYINTGYEYLAMGEMPDDLRARVRAQERPWIARALESVKGWFAHPNQSGSPVAASMLPAAPRGAIPGDAALAASQVDARRERRGGQTGSAAPISLVATGASSGEVFKLVMPNVAGAPRHIVAPDGLVLQPIRQGAVRPAAQQAGAPAKQETVTGFCLDYLKPPPPKGMQYQVAPEAVQKKFEPMRKILEAGRQLADAGVFKPDSNPADYATFIRQWALWTKLNRWDLNAFTREFISRTKKNVENLGRKWTGEMEAALKKAAPNRYFDIMAVLAEAEGLRQVGLTASR
jgi:hypothetical protein